MAVRRTVADTPSYLHPAVARIILARSKARQGVRLSYAVLLLHADAAGIIIGRTPELAKVAGWEHETFRGHLGTLRRLGELDTIRSPTSRRPGIWRINALA